MKYLLALVLASALMPVSGVRAQETSATFEVMGGNAQKLTLAVADLAKMPRAAVKLDGAVPSNYEGVWLHEILKKAGVAMGERLRGKALTTYVIAEARDGYSVLFSLAEVDPSFTKGEILLADTLDGKPLAADSGPFRLVVASDKPGARSVRMLARLEIVQVKK